MGMWENHSDSISSELAYVERETVNGLGLTFIRTVRSQTQKIWLFCHQSDLLFSTIFCIYFRLLASAVILKIAYCIYSGVVTAN